MDVKSLYTVVAVSDCGSFAAAADALGVSVSSVSLQIRALEEEAGDVFFDRSSRPPRLTPEGREFVERARNLLDHWEALSDGLKRESARGVLKIGAVHTCVAGAVPTALRRLRDAQPDLHIRLSTVLTDDLMEKVKGGILDCGILTEPAALADDLSFQCFVEEPLVVIAHRSALGETDQELLAQNPYVRFSRHAFFARLVDRELHRRQIDVTSRMEIDMLDAVISLVVADLGVSIVPDQAGGLPFPPEIKAVPLGNPPVVRRLGVLTRQDSAKSRLISMLFEELNAVYGTDADQRRDDPPIRPGPVSDRSPVSVQP